MQSGAVAATLDHEEKGPQKPGGSSFDLTLAHHTVETFSPSPSKNASLALISQELQLTNGEG